MKYIKKIFESKFSVEDEFQSIIDTIQTLDKKYFSFIKKENLFTLNYNLHHVNNNKIDNPIAELETFRENSETLSNLIEDIKHICIRLKDDGYSSDLIFQNGQLIISIDTNDDNFIEYADDIEIYIIKSKMKYFLKRKFNLIIEGTEIKYRNNQSGDFSIMYLSFKDGYEIKKVNELIKFFSKLKHRADSWRGNDDLIEEIDFDNRTNELYVLFTNGLIVNFED